MMRLRPKSTRLLIGGLVALVIIFAGHRSLRREERVHATRPAAGAESPSATLDRAAIDERRGRSEIVVDGAVAGGGTVVVRLVAVDAAADVADKEVRLRSFSRPANGSGDWESLLAQSATEGGQGSATDDAGQAEFRRLADGTYAVSIDDASTYIASSGWIAVSEEHRSFTIPVRRGGSIVGRVIGEDGRALGNAEVGLQMGGALSSASDVISPPPFSPASIRTAVTNENGYYELSGILEHSILRVGASHPHYAPATSDSFTIRPHERRELPPLRLERGGALEVEVSDDQGAPVTEFTVTIDPRDESFYSYDTTEHVSDGAGRFVACNLPLGPYEVRISGDGWAPSEQTAAVVHGTTTLGFVLTAGTQLAGVVRDERGDGVPSARVLASGPLYRKRLETDSEGRFLLEGVPAGQLNVFIAHDRFASTKLMVPDALEAEDLEVTLSRGAGFRGVVVTADGEPFSPFAIVLGHPRDGRFREHRRVDFADPGGEFEVWGLPARRFTVMAISPDGRTGTDERRPSADGVPVRLQLGRTRTYAGLATDSTTGATLPASGSNGVRRSRPAPLPASCMAPRPETHGAMQRVAFSFEPKRAAT